MAIDEWWISDYSSYIFQKSASMFVMAVEDSVVLQISFEDEQRLKGANLKAKSYFVKGMALDVTVPGDIKILTQWMEDNWGKLEHHCYLIANALMLPKISSIIQRLIQLIYPFTFLM